MPKQDLSPARRPRLLVLSFFPCFYPPRSGGESRLFNLYRQLAERFEIILLSSTDHDEPLVRVVYSPWFVEYRVLRGSAYRAAYGDVRRLASEADISAVSVAIAGAYPSGLHEAYLRHHAWADIIVHESPFTLPYDLLLGFDAKPRVYDSHNAESALMRMMHPGPRAAPIHDFAEACERALTNAADLVLVCSEGDQGELERLTGGPLRAVALAPNGTAEPPEGVGAAREIRAAGATRLLFVGSRHQPNVDAARFLIDQVAPRLGGLELHIAGACMPEGRPAPNVVCHGEVTTHALAELWASSDIALNPMVTGGGSNLKVLDYMSSGLPVVATAFGMRGTFAEAGRHFVEADLAGFADATAALAADPGARERLAREALALVREHLTWRVIADQLGGRLRSLAGARKDREPIGLWLCGNDPTQAADGSRTLALLRGFPGPACVLCLHGGARIERVAIDARVTMLRVPAVAGAEPADNPILAGLYDCLRRIARHIVVQTAALGVMAARFGEPFDYVPDAADAAGPFDQDRAFCARKARRMVAITPEDGSCLSAARTDRGEPMPMVPAEGEGVQRGAESYAALALATRPARRRLLIVTYRYTDPPLGGAEVLLLELLRHLDASGEWEIDIVCPAVGSIANEDRFGCVYGDVAGLGAAPGLLRTRWRRFPVASASTAIPEEMERAWEVQAAFDRAVAQDPEMASAAAAGPRLLAGWSRLLPPGTPDAVRWTTEEATLHAGAGGQLVLHGTAPRPMEISVTGSGCVRGARVAGEFTLEAEVGPGQVVIRSEARRMGIPEMGPVGICISRLDLNGTRLLDLPTLTEEAAGLRFDRRVAVLDRAAEASRAQAELELSRLRGPHAPELGRWVRENVANYDVLLTQNCVFRPAIDAIAAAAAQGVPSVFIPHIHLDDDFYHFPDILRALRQASVSLVSPRSARDFLACRTGADIRYFASGGVSPEEFDASGAASDMAAFRAVLPDDGRPTILVLGRKAWTKHYEVAFDARVLLAQRGIAARVVMIGPDDDGVAIDQPDVHYLGRQPREVVRGALRSASVLVNMSASESFGIVLLEAWLGGLPVIANRQCGAFADIVQDGMNGFLVETAEEVADRAALLLSDRALAGSMAWEGRALARSLSWPQRAAELCGVCMELAERRDARMRAA